MKKLLFISALVMAVAGYAFSCFREKVTPEKSIAQTLVTQVDSFAAIKNTLLDAVESGKTTDQQLQQLFRQVRLSYKKFEWAAEYFVPQTTRFINGAPTPEVEMAGTLVLDPQGLQVIESLLFPKYNISKKQELIQRLKLLQTGCDQYKSHFNNVDIIDGQVFDAAKLQVFRVLTLGITGFDTPLLQNSLAESAVSLESLKPILAYYGNEDDTAPLLNSIISAAMYLKTHNNFNTFNRAEFITQYGNPVTVSLSNLEQQLHIHVIQYNRLLNQDAKTLFDKNAFNVNAYTTDASFGMTQEKIALGKKLFADPILSGSRTRSCQSCHQPEKAFTDGLTKNTVVEGNALLSRNTPTLLNAALQPSLFYDIRAISLEDQALNVVANKQEMHGSVSKAANLLWQNATYRKLFTNAFPKKNRTSIDSNEVVNALGSYVRSLTLLNSRFDEYMRGNKAAMTQEEVNGFNLFMGKAKCGTCHYMPLFNGTFPPRFTKIETEVIGVPQTIANKALDQDMGRFSFVKIDAFKHAFKTTTVRNAARTAPYMHNGVFTTLDEVVDFYNKGGGAGLGLKVDNQTLPFDQLHLSQKESHEITAFIKSLDSKVVL
ncbi:cytochrome C peroxidase [Mucilaginibacter robiniae]|uniref:Cytochrome C peroxidase n=1 Tax=Mucilaginibacter robiniae TaxID=2728022 RepID=A0A7L5E0L8_9SPHI|nr:cytochrome c peroxidase [Mucilaginibacter robiniae]QJD96571.1 cytochrome C peroxidase [Mucilaginibacter robiniae]